MRPDPTADRHRLDATITDIALRPTERHPSLGRITLHAWIDTRSGYLLHWCVSVPDDGAPVDADSPCPHAPICDTSAPHRAGPIDTTDEKESSHAV